MEEFRQPYMPPEQQTTPPQHGVNVCMWLAHAQEEFGKNVTTKAKTPADWKAMRTPMFTRAYNEYISSLQAGGNYQGALENPREP